MKAAQFTLPPPASSSLQATWRPRHWNPSYFLFNAKPAFVYAWGFCCIPILGFQCMWEDKTTLPYIICCRWTNNPPFFPKCSWLKDPGVKFTHVTLHCLYALWGWNPTHERQPAKHIFQRVLRPTPTSKQNFTTQLFPDHSLITTRTQVHKLITAICTLVLGWLHLEQASK